MTDILPTLTRLFSKGKDSIEKDEFKTKVTILTDDENTTKGQETVLKKVAENIDRFDTNHDGKISLDEIIGFAKTEGNKDGKITKEDFSNPEPEQKTPTALLDKSIARYNYLIANQVKEVQSLQDQYTLVAGRRKGDGEADPTLADLGKMLAAAQTRLKLYNDFLTASKNLRAAQPTPTSPDLVAVREKYTTLLADQISNIETLRDQYVMFTGRRGDEEPALADLGKKLVEAESRAKLYSDFLNQALGVQK